MPGIDGPDFKLVKSALNQNTSPNFFSQPFEMMSKNPVFTNSITNIPIQNSKVSIKELKSPKSNSKP